jgi:hypothetical protein
MRLSFVLLLAAALAIPTVAHCRGLGAKYHIMKGDGDYASFGYNQAALEKMGNRSSYRRGSTKK